MKSESWPKLTVALLVVLIAFVGYFQYELSRMVKLDNAILAEASAAASSANDAASAASDAKDSADDAKSSADDCESTAEEILNR